MLFRSGAATLLRRGAGHLTGRSAAYDVDVPRVASDAEALAVAVEAGATAGWIDL